MKVLRSTLVIAAAAFAAACGDKVTVTQQGPDTTVKVLSVTVSPASVVMAVNQTVTFTAVVDVQNGAATTVNWSPTSGAVSVSPAGVATANSASPGVAICATSSIDATKKGCAQAVVTSAATTTPPSISIASVNFTNGAGQQQPAPVPPGGIAGQVNVVMNVNFGSAVPDSVVLKVDGKNAYKQSFSASMQSALVSESVSAAEAGIEPANQAATTITASVNTADYSTTTGAATWQNGNRSFQAFIYGKNAATAGGAPTNVQGNSPATTYRFANPDGFHVTVSLTTLTAGARAAGETQLASAVDAAGLGWKSGSLGVSALFVQFTPGITPTIVRATFNNIGCSPLATGVKSLVLANTGTGAPVAGPYTGTFNANPATTNALSVDDYEFSPAAAGCPAAAVTSGGEIISMVAIGSDNNGIVLSAGRALAVPGPAIVFDGIGVLNAAATSLNPDPTLVLRLDNVGPGAINWDLQSTNSANGNCATGTGVASMGARTNCWLNDNVVLNGRQTGFAGVPASTTTTNGVIAAATDAGSGRLIGTADGLSFTARVGLATDATATVDGTAAVTSLGAAGANLAESATNGFYRLRTRSVDLLGNVTNSGSTTVGNALASLFGVDRTIPTLSIIAGPAANARALVAGGAYTFFDTDPLGTAGASSGFFAVGVLPMTTIQTRRDQANGTNFFCPSAVVGPPAGPVYRAAGTATANPCGTVGLVVGWTAGNNQTYPSNLTVPDVNLSGTNPTLDAYYTISATVADQAGNVSAAASRVELVDATAPAAGGILYSPILLTSGGAVTLSTAVSDNLDLQLSRANIEVGAAGGFAATIFDANTGAGFAPTSGVGGGRFWYNDAAINGYNLTPLVNTNVPVNYAIASLVTHYQVTAAAVGTNTGAFGAANNPVTANIIVVNQATVAQPTVAGTFAIGTTPILGASLPAGITAMVAGGAAGAGPVQWAICGMGTVACPVIPAAPAAATQAVSRDGATAGNPTTFALDAVATGTTGVFTNPFSSVQFYAYDATAGANAEGWRLIGTINSASVTDGLAAAPNGRNWHFQMVWDPSASDAPIAAGTVYRIVAIGIGGPNLAVATARGVGLVSPVGGITVTLNP